jgi:hypothetical protein
MREPLVSLFSIDKIYDDINGRNLYLVAFYGEPVMYELTRQIAEDRIQLLVTKMLSPLNLHKD